MGYVTNQYIDDTTTQICGTVSSINKETGRDFKPSRAMSLLNTHNIFIQTMGRFVFINYLYFP